jgi:hypothetical protein
MQAARRQTQHQLDVIDRRIARKGTSLVPISHQPQRLQEGGRPRRAAKLLERYRACLGALTAERQPELDALSGKLARQDAAIAVLVARQHR